MKFRLRYAATYDVLRKTHVCLHVTVHPNLPINTIMNVTRVTVLVGQVFLSPESLVSWKKSMMNTEQSEHRTCCLFAELVKAT